MNVTGSGPYPISGEEGLPVGTIVGGVFGDRESARQAIIELERAGFDLTQVKVAALEKSEQEELAVGDVEPLNERTTVDGSFGGALVEGVARLIAGGRGAANIVYSTLVRLGFTEAQARYYEQGYEAGRILVVVDAPLQGDVAVTVLRNHGADLGPVSKTAPVAETDPGTTVSTSGSTPPSTGPSGLNLDER